MSKSAHTLEFRVKVAQEYLDGLISIEIMGYWLLRSVAETKSIPKILRSNV